MIKRLFNTVFSGIPKGVTVRRLDDNRKAVGQDKPYKFSAWYNDKPGSTRYGNSIPEALKNLGSDVKVHIH